MLLVRVCFLICFWGISSAVFAQTPQEVLKAFTANLTGIAGHFEQQVVDPDGNPVEESRGEIALQLPRQFRWEYQSPFPQLIVADGNKIWIHDPDLEQVQVRPQGAEEQQSPLTALLNPDELEQQFVVREGGKSDGLSWVDLTPKGDDAPFSQARLGFSADHQLQQMEMTDALAQRTVMRFSGWQRNPDFSPDTFRFIPTPEMDVVGDVEDAAQAYPLQE